MSTTGNFEPWIESFPSGYLPNVFHVIFKEWPNFTRTENKPLENRITNRFVGHLQRTSRGKYPFAFGYRPKLADPNSDTESGEIDIEVRCGIDPLVYFAFECKRLNVINNGRLQSKAGEYVGDGGMGCFISGQYNGGGNSGGMLGYVMDNQIETAQEAVDNAISKRQIQLRMFSPAKRRQTDFEDNDPRITQTDHDVDGTRFVIFHLFVGISG